MSKRCCAKTDKGTRCKLAGVRYVSDGFWLCRSHFEVAKRRCVNVADDFSEYNRVYGRFLKGTKPNGQETDGE